MFFVGATTVKCLLFLNHRNRKVVGDKHNILVHCVNVCAHDPSSVFFCNLFKWDILWFIISDHESSCYFCVCNNKQSGRRQTQCSSTLCECLGTPDLSGVVLCNPCKWDILSFIISDPESCCCLCAWRVPAQRDSVLCNKGQSADRRFCYNTRYAVKYYQLGGFLASTEALLFYNWPIIIHALNQDASTGVGGVSNALLVICVEFRPFGLRRQSWKQRITGLIKKKNSLRGKFCSVNWQRSIMFVLANY